MLVNQKKKLVLSNGISGVCFVMVVMTPLSHE